MWNILSSKLNDMANKLPQIDEALKETLKGTLKESHRGGSQERSHVH